MSAALTALNSDPISNGTFSDTKELKPVHFLFVIVERDDISENNFFWATENCHSGSHC